MTPTLIPVTKENFPEVWQSVDAQRRTAKKKYISASFAPFFSNMVFAILVLLVGNGLIHDHLKGSYSNFLEDIPFFLTVWDKAAGLLIKPEWSIALKIAVPLLVMYLVCFLVCLIFVLLVTAVYHPFRRQLPEGTDKENAELLLSMARDARRYSLRTVSSGSMLWALIFMMLQFMLIALYWLLALENNDAVFTLIISPVMKLLEPFIADVTMTQRASIEMALFTPCLMLFCLGIYIVYAFLNQVHALSVQFMYKYNVPYSFVADVEYYYTFADEDTTGMTEEEIITRRRESAQTKRTEGLEMEKLGAYGRAKELLSQAAHSGDAEAMAHYARHWLIAQAKDPAKYWLQKCVDTGEVGEYAVKTLRRLKWHLRVRAAYLK